MQKDRILEYIGAFVLAFLLVIGFSLISAFPTKWLVNYLFSEKALISVFGVCPIGFWKSFWLNFFFVIAFKSYYIKESKK